MGFGCLSVFWNRRFALEFKVTDTSDGRLIVHSSGTSMVAVANAADGEAVAAAQADRPRSTVARYSRGRGASETPTPAPRKPPPPPPRRSEGAAARPPPPPRRSTEAAARPRAPPAPTPAPPAEDEEEVAAEDEDDGEVRAPIVTAEAAAAQKEAADLARHQIPPQEACKYTVTEGGGQVSRPGKPCIPPAEVWPYDGYTRWRNDLGDRVLKALAGTLTSKDCGGFKSFGDYTWCTKALGGRTALGLSSGNEAYDAWGEKLSRAPHRVPTRFYNCFTNGRNGDPGLPYKLFDECLGPDDMDNQGRKYKALETILSDREPVSVHLRLDTEVSGWTILEKMLNSADSMSTLRTLDVDFHLANRAPFDEGWQDVSEQELLEKQIKVVEKMLRHFHVVGSTVEVFRMGWRPEQDCPDQTCGEPPVYMSGGFSPQRFAVSYVKRELVAVGAGGGAAEEGAGGGAAEEGAGFQDAGGEDAGGEEAAGEEAAESGGEDKQSGRPLNQVLYKKPESTCTYLMPNQVSSRPGPPCLPPAEVWPYVSNTPWRTKVGERIVRSVTPDITSEECDGWNLFGDQTWCNKAFGGTDVIGLSYGIEERDLYSEYLSNHYHIPTKLFDCFIELEKSPPMAGTAPNGEGEGSCKGKDGHCYETAYESFRICLGPENTKIDTDKGTGEYNTLAKQLEGFGPLSVHVKIDVEGSEWTVLEALLQSDEDQAKIRTLDMEIHFGFAAASESATNGQSLEERLEREVGIIEGLSKNFRVTGSTLETYRQGWWPTKDCPEQQCHEPIVHTAGGFSPQMFAVSFVNRAFWAPGAAKASGGRGGSKGGRRSPAPQPRPRPRPTPAPEPIAEDFDEAAVEVAGGGAVLPYPGGKVCTWKLPDQVSSRPGPPCIPPAKKWPYETNTPWRSKLGERIVRSVDQGVSSEKCNGWNMFGDSTWCNKAFTKTPAPGVIGLSYGIEERDLYSEYLSNNYGIPTKLYDCFIEPEKSPPMAGKAPNGTKKCNPNGGHCYGTTYQSYRVCLGPEKTKVDGRKYDTLANHLKGREPLSVHLKIDVEGSEWTVLENFIASDLDQAKVRTLDMEIHFGFRAASEAKYDDFPEEERIERQIRIIEGLRKRFYCTGTTLETYRQGWFPEKDCPQQQCSEPVVHTAGGYSPQMFAVSYVNKAIVDGELDLQAEEPATGFEEEATADEPAPTPAPRPRPRPRPRPPPAAEEGEEGEAAAEVAVGAGQDWPSLEKCTYLMPTAHSSRPGRPCLPPFPTRWPYKTNTAWRTEFGERIVLAVTPKISEKACEGWTLYGDQTWCNKAFKRKGSLALSFGIEERDMYSEYLSNVYKVPSKLFDCFQNPVSSPPMSGKACNATNCHCQTGGGAPCYETPYQSFRVCLGPKKMKSEGRSYDTLANVLKGRKPLSTHVKIDVEGSEWSVLEQLIASDEDQDKIITLDMEIHFGFTAASESEYNSMDSKDRLLREIKIIEGLSRKFHVTGSTLEEYRQGWLPDQDCPQQQCDEPVVHVAGGFTPRMFAISYVNKNVLADDIGDVFEGAKEIGEAQERQEEAVADDSGGQSAEEERSYLPPEPVDTSQKYGFYLHVYNFPAAVIHQVRQLKKHFPGSPIYVMSDGGMSFKELCKQEGCRFMLCPPANDRWHPWPFLRRMYDAALYLETEYIIMLEPDNTIHGPITREPQADAGGLPVKDRKFGYREYAEKLAQKRKPGFKWTDRAMSAGLAGGAYFKREVILDALSDESVASLDWNYLGESATKEVYSSDFAMQYLLAARGYTMEPWEDCAQMDRKKDIPIAGAKDSAFRHYCGCYPGGKPTYNLQVKPEDRGLYQEELPKHKAENSNCQLCYDLKEYVKDWGSARCTNPNPFKYSKLMMSRYFPDGKIPTSR